MTQDELIELLRKPEWRDVEFEEARRKVPCDAAAEWPDGRAVDLNPATAFDPDAIRWYRSVYEARPGNRSCAAMSDMDFLAEMGLLVGQGGRRLPTRAAILIFGTNPAFRQKTDVAWSCSLR